MTLTIFSIQVNPRTYNVEVITYCLISAATCVALLSFTFHYVSIKSRVCAFDISKAVVFTFHYVSIKSAHWETYTERDSHLHSTMYLLNQIPSSEVPIATAFTFHYVSIKSQACYNDHFPIFNLHSTMYLLNLIKSAWAFFAWSFTFHYVSIKSRRFFL